MSLIDPLLTEVMVCPADHGSLVEDLESSELACQTCGRRYPVIDGIPIMLVDKHDDMEDTNG